MPLFGFLCRKGTLPPGVVAYERPDPGARQPRERRRPGGVQVAEPRPRLAVDARDPAGARLDA